MRFRTSVFLALLYLIPFRAQSQEIQVGIGPSQAEISVGQDGLPVTVAPTLFFGAPDQKHVQLIHQALDAKGPRVEFSSSTYLEPDQLSTILPFTVIPTKDTATGTYNYEWRYRLETPRGNIKVAIPFKLKVNVVEHEKDIEAPYLWYPINTTYTSPLVSIDVPRFLVTQRQKEQPIRLRTNSSYPRKIANITLTGTLSSSRLGELSTTSTVALNPSATGTIPFLIPALPLGKSNLTFDLIDKSASITIITLPTHQEFAALITLLASLLVASLFISKKKQK